MSPGCFWTWAGAGLRMKQDGQDEQVNGGAPFTDAVQPHKLNVDQVQHIPQAADRETEECRARHPPT